LSALKNGSANSSLSLIPHNPQLTLLNKQRKHRVDSPGIRRFVADLTAAMGRSAAEFSVVFITDHAMRTYNYRYRGMDKATDVLSFEGEGDYLGDILISTETAWAQTRKSPTLSFDDNVRRLVLHGFLHLSGYDHETDNGEMRAIERRLRRKFQC
jgi:probable rRNA maturation factor